MKKLLCIISLFALASFFTSCSNDPAARKVTADMVTDGLTIAIVQGLDCEAEDIIKSEVQEKIYEWFKVNSHTGVAQDICKAAIGTVIPQLIGTAVPAHWNCKKEKLENASQFLSEFACSKLN